MTNTSFALITGASRGLGAGLAEALAPQHHIIAVARTQSGLETLDDRVRAVGGTATLVPLDLTAKGSILGLAQALADRFSGKLALWAHTAIHAPPLAPVDQISAKDWTRSLAVNAELPGQLIGAIGPFLRGSGEALFFDDPMISERFAGAYGASKAAQMTLARTWQAETARVGPRVRILTPRPMATALRARFFPGEARDNLAAPLLEARRLLGQ